MRIDLYFWQAFLKTDFRLLHLRFIHQENHIGRIHNVGLKSCWNTISKDLNWLAKSPMCNSENDFTLELKV